MKLTIKDFFDPATYTLTYVVSDENSKDAVIIDPVWDYDPAASKLSTQSVNAVLSYLKDNNLNPHYVLETHAHADHLSGSQEFKKFYPHIQVVIGENIKAVQKVFKGLFNLGEDFDTEGKSFDLLLKDDSTLKAGTLNIKTIFTPGHTPACASYLIEDAVFTGDALFMPDYGTGRCDFPAGSAEALYDSVQKLYKLPETTRVFVGHDYQPGGRGVEFETTIGESKRNNIQLKSDTTKKDFVDFRNRRDKTLSAPKLLLPSVQINIMAGKLPKNEDNGVSYLKIPLR